MKRELAATREKLARKEDGSLFDLRHDTADNIAEVVVANISENKARSIASAIVAKNSNGHAGAVDP